MTRSQAGTFCTIAFLIAVGVNFVLGWSLREELATSQRIQREILVLKQDVQAWRDSVTTLRQELSDALQRSTQALAHEVAPLRVSLMAIETALDEHQKLMELVYSKLLKAPHQ